MQQEFDNPGYNFSTFQKQFINEIENGAGFTRWVQCTLGKQIRKQQWSCFIWVTTDGKMHSQRVGVKRLLGEMFTPA